MVAFTLSGRKFVKAQQAPGQSGRGAAILRPQTGTVAAGLLNGLVERGIGNVAALTLEDEIRLFQSVSS